MPSERAVRSLSRGVCVFLAVAVGGCTNNVNMADGGAADMAMQVTLDMAKLPDMAVPPDMATPVPQRGLILFKGTTKDPAMTPYFGAATPVAAGQAIEFASPGGAVFGAFDTMTMAKASEGVVAVEDLNTIKYDPAADTVLHFFCPEKGGTQA